MKNKRKRTPIPGLAEAIAGISGLKLRKNLTAPILASVADRLYALSIPTSRQRLR